MHKNNIVNGIAECIRNIVCSRCGCTGTQDCARHIVRCEQEYKAEAESILDWLLENDLLRTSQKF